MKVSVIIPVYFNADSLEKLYEDIKNKFISQIDYEYEIVMVDDGSEDDSYRIIQRLAECNPHIRAIRLSRNFGSHAAILCGLEYSQGDCAIIKAADLQEPTEMLHEMVGKWKDGNNVVLALRKDREDGRGQTFFANFYYWLTRKVALPEMPKGGFDIYLVDRKVIDVLTALDERNSALTGQILWSGFRTAYVYYVRRERETGKSRWTLRKKIRLVTDTLFSFSTMPIKAVGIMGLFSVLMAVVWAIVVLFGRIRGTITVSGWTTMFIFLLFSFGVIMMTLGILGEYLWRIFDASRKRPTYIIEESDEDRYE